MRITKHLADKQGLITIRNVGRLLTMGLQENVVTLWAETDPLAGAGLPIMVFKVHQDGDSPKPEPEERYITSFINDKSCQHLYAVAQKIINDPMPSAMSRTNPGAKDDFITRPR